MTRIATNVPAENDLLCEHCGYTLNGLPTDGRCPECGSPVADSLGTNRSPAAWETSGIPRLAAFGKTTVEIIFSTTCFYRTLTTRGSVTPARSFARIHWIAASILFGLTANIHLNTMSEFEIVFNGPNSFWLEPAATFGLTIAVYLLLAGTTRLAARLTNWEATYRGYRLTRPVVLRGMYYHAAHYLPVALIAFITVAGYRRLQLNGELTHLNDAAYLYVIAAEVIVGAIYLFQTYWIAMRNMMYANR